MSDHKAVAEELLVELSTGTPRYAQYLKVLSVELKMGNLTLNDIGSSEEDIEKILVQSHKTSARMWLFSARKTTYYRVERVRNMRTELRLGKLTLADIGTTEREIELLIQAVA